VEQLSRLARGLVLIGGPAGSGKSTTVAALVHEINRRDARHIVTIEDPIEYEHANIRSVIEQVEVGNDAPDFPTALRAALRQAPDVLVVGEMRDPETMRIAVTAAETGHLVFSTLHTTDVASTISRISDSFPPERQNSIRQELAMRFRPCSPDPAAQQARWPLSRGGDAADRPWCACTSAKYPSAAPGNHHDQEDRIFSWRNRWRH
jgi:twitching motility protein PilT